MGGDRPPEAENQPMTQNGLGIVERTSTPTHYCETCGVAIGVLGDPEQVHEPVEHMACGGENTRPLEADDEH